MIETALAFGSNVGDKQANVRAAVALLDREAGLELDRTSSLYRTAPWGFTDQDWFVNACAVFRTSLDPRQLLAVCKATERSLGRQASVRWGPRLIDIDILTFGGEAVAEPDLTIPHPHMRDRGFVLVPLAEIAPDLDIGGVSVRQALAAVDRQGISAIDPD